MERHVCCADCKFSIVSRWAAHVSNPPGVKEQAAGVSEKGPNQPSIALSYFLTRLPRAALATSVSTRESILFRVPPSSQCFRGGKPAFYTGADYPNNNDRPAQAQTTSGLCVRAWRPTGSQNAK